jgi:hypothetical protein
VAHRIRDLALFNFALDSKLRACDLVALRFDDVALPSTVLLYDLTSTEATLPTGPVGGQ